MSTSKKIGIIAAVIVFVAAAFGGGMLLGRNSSTAALPSMPGAAVAGGPGGQGGPMANLTAQEQAELENMTEEERQAFFQEKMGSAAPGGPGGPARGGQLEGEVVDYAADSLTIKLESGSQNVYYDGDTVIAYQEGAGTLASGSKVIVIAEPAADGVTNASAIIVKK